MKYSKISFFTAALIAVVLSGPVVQWGAAQTVLPKNADSQQNKYADCLKCHDYEQNHHPVQIEPFKEISFPLSEDGKIECTTCHYEDHLSGGRNYLRGGPYIQPRELCLNCHRSESYKGINPHEMLDENGRVKKIIGGQPVCIICHVSKPDPEVDRTEDVKFRADVGFLCWRCHQPMANARFFTQHFLVEPSSVMREDIQKNEAAMNVLIPLVPRDRITCSTCHNPHQKGVILREAAAKGADEADRLRMPSPRLCFVCHPVSTG